jgi:ubiquinone biosynthesis protein UbiJ
MLVESPLLSLEMLMNRQIAASTPARAALAQLQGRSFAVVLTGAANTLLRLHLEAAREGLRLSVGDRAADAAVKGSPLSLIQLLAGRRSGGSHQAGVTIDGDATVVQGFENLFRLAELDIEGELARLIGDRPAVLTVQAAQRMFAAGRRLFSSLARSTGDYLVEEGRDVVGRLELNAFNEDVDRLRDDVARLEARLDRLSRSGVVRP